MTEEDIEVWDLAGVALLVLEGARHGVGDDLVVGAYIRAAGEYPCGLFAIAIIVVVQPFTGAQHRLHDANAGVGVLLSEGIGHAKDLLWVVLPDLIIGHHGNADALEDSLLVPGLADAITEDGARLESGWHLRWWGYGKLYLRF